MTFCINKFDNNFARFDLATRCFNLTICSQRPFQNKMPTWWGFMIQWICEKSCNWEVVGSNHGTGYLMKCSASLTLKKKIKWKTKKLINNLAEIWATALLPTNWSPDCDGVGSSHWDQNRGDHSVPEKKEEGEDHLTQVQRLADQQRNFNWK